MSRITTLTLAGLAVTGLTVVGTVPAAQAAPLPAMTGDAVGGAKTTVDHVGWRRGHYGGYHGPRYGYGYGHRRRNVGGALFAGAALGLIGGAIAASAAPRYGYYGGGYGGYGYARPVYYGGYGGYGYRPVYGYPAYGGYGGYYGW